jgi:hypothetical protein
LFGLVKKNSGRLFLLLYLRRPAFALSANKKTPILLYKTKVNNQLNSAAKGKSGVDFLYARLRKKSLSTLHSAKGFF